MRALLRAQQSREMVARLLRRPETGLPRNDNSLMFRNSRFIYNLYNITPPSQENNLPSRETDCALSTEKLVIREAEKIRRVFATDAALGKKRIVS